VVPDLTHSTVSWVSARALDCVREVLGREGITDMSSLVVGTDAGRRCFAALPKEMRCIGHFGNDILANSPEEAFIVANRTVMTGPAGTFVLFDGARVAHRGGIVKAGHRWALQVIYSKVPS